MSKKETHIAIVLDRSGSMSSVRDETIDAFNEQIKEIKENADKGGVTRVSFYTFGGKYEDEVTIQPAPAPKPTPKPSPWPTDPWYRRGTGGSSVTRDNRGNYSGTVTFKSGTNRKPVETLFKDERAEILDPLTYESYVPNGLTPMYDGIGRAISDLEEKDEGADQQAFLLIVVSDGKENHSREWSADNISDKVTELQNTGRWTFVFLGANVELSEVEGDLNFQPGNTAAFVANSTGVQKLGSSMAGATASYMSVRSAGGTQSEAYGDEVSEELEKSKN